MNLAIFPLLAFAIVTFGPGSRFHLEHSQDSFGMRSHGIIETLGAGRTKFYKLPQSTAAEYLRLRRDPLPAPDRYQSQEVIGPYQLEAGRLWFGNNYYDGEGDVGVGAFGYFDTVNRTYTLYSPPDVARYEISAILVEPDWVWLGLDRFGEDISTSPGGLVQWNRKTHEVRRYVIEFGISGIRVESDSLRLQTRAGYALFHDGQFRRFLANGKAIAKFPPPPTHYY